MKSVNLLLIAALAVAALLAGCAAPSAAIETVEVGPHRELRVNGRPLFPLMNFYQSPKSFEHAAAMGLNGYFMPGSKPPPREYLDALQALGLYGVVPFDEAAVGHPALLAWVQPHEPDALKGGKVGTPPDEVLRAYRRIRAADSSRPVVLDLSPNLMLRAEFARGPMSADEKRRIYPEFARGGDVLTYNVYPIWGHNRPEKIDWVAEAADDLKTLVGPAKPFWAMIETGKGSRSIPEAEQHDVSVDQIRAEVWLAITHGATGIIYFTHQFKPSFSEFAPGAAKQAGIREINAEITRLAPVILSGPPEVAVAADVFSLNTVSANGRTHAPMSWMARRHEGSLYVFVLNASPRAYPLVEVAAEGLKAGSAASVVGTWRSVRADAGRFLDAQEIRPYELRVYRIRL